MTADNDESAPQAGTNTVGRQAASRPQDSYVMNATTNSRDASLSEDEVFTAVAGRDRISWLPAETLDQILDNIQDLPTKAALCRVSKRFYAFGMPRLYGAVEFVHPQKDVNETQLARAMEAFLSSQQVKDLEEDFLLAIYLPLDFHELPDTDRPVIDESERPLCCVYPRQLSVTWPNLSTLYYDSTETRLDMRMRLVSLLRNLPNIEVFRSTYMDRGVAESLVSIKHLHSLYLRLHYNLTETDRAQLSQITGLANLSIEILCPVNAETYPADTHSKATVNDMIRSSAPTLESLAMMSLTWATPNWHDSRSWIPVSNEQYGAFRLPVLHSLKLCCMYIDGWVVDLLSNSIMFTKLRELHLANSIPGPESLLQRLASTFRETENSGDSPQLSTLFLHVPILCKESGNSAADAFLASFNTLESLTLKNFNCRNRRSMESILKYKSLHTLRVLRTLREENGFDDQCPPHCVTTVMEGLPLLRNFHFPLFKDSWEETANALALGRSLTSVVFDCRPCDLDPIHLATPWFPYPLIMAFLSHAAKERQISSDGKFVWEDHFHLRDATITARPYWRRFDIGSALHGYDGELQEFEYPVNGGQGGSLGVIARARQDEPDANDWDRQVGKAGLEVEIRQAVRIYPEELDPTAECVNYQSDVFDWRSHFGIDDYWLD